LVDIVNVVLAAIVVDARIAGNVIDVISLASIQEVRTDVRVAAAAAAKIVIAALIKEFVFTQAADKAVAPASAEHNILLTLPKEKIISRTKINRLGVVLSCCAIGDKDCVVAPHGVITPVIVTAGMKGGGVIVADLIFSEVYPGII
jgi:hypothetical protein